MAAENIIKTLSKIENILGVHRNYVCLPKRYRIFCIIRIICETVVYMYFMALVGIENINIIHEHVNYVLELFRISKSLNSPMIMANGIFYSSACRVFIENFKFAYDRYQDQPTFIKWSKKLIWILIMYAVTFTVLNSFLFAAILYILITAGASCNVIILVTMDMLFEIRFFNEHVVMYTYVMMTKNLLGCLNDSILEVQVKYNERQKRLLSESQEWDGQLTVDQVVQWATQFQCLLNCSKSVSVCFNVVVIYFFIILSSTFCALMQI